MADLITLEQLKIALGIPNPADPHPDDAKNAAAIAAASAIVRNYTDLTFELSTGTISTRQFEYDGSGFLDIDDAQQITAVTEAYGGVTNSYTRTLTADDWVARPFNTPIKYWLQLAGENYFDSPEMGFTWNADTYSGRNFRYPNIVNVTAIWGWDEIPADVQQATIWTALHLAENPKNLIAESIEGYSRTYTSGGGTLADALPDRAEAVLAPYVLARV